MSAATYYVGTEGTSSGNGSEGSPWNLATALNHPAAVRPGDTLLLKAGTYKTTNYAAGENYFLRSRLTGSANLPITVMPVPGSRVTIDGGIEINGNWVIFRDLEVTSSHPQRTTSIAGPWPEDIRRPGAFTVLGKNVKLINNILHDGGNGIEGWAGASDNEYYGNIIYYQGWLGPDRGHGHGLYMQNLNGTKQGTDNIIFRQFGQGIQVYGSSSTALNNFHLEGNIVFDNGQLASQYTRNILVGGTAQLNNPVLIDNYAYYPTSWTHGGENNIGYSTAGGPCNNLTFRGNYFVTNGPALSLYRCSIASFTGNTLWGTLRGILATSLPGLNNLVTMARLSQPAVFVRANRYERGRGHIVVFNWDRRDAVSADISGIGLAPGDAYEVVDVQNYFGSPIASGTYVGGVISIPMTSTAVAPAVGNVRVQPVHTDREFGAFVVRKRGGGTTSPPPTTALQISNVAVSQVSSTSAVVTWTTDRSSSTTVNYGPSTSLGYSVSGSAGVTHIGYLNGLTPGTTYYLRVRSVDGSGIAAEAAGPVFVTTAPPPVSTAVQISGVGVSQISSSSAMILWTTNRAATTEVSYGTSTAYGLTAAGVAGTSHTVTLSGLAAGTTYYFQVRSNDGLGTSVMTGSPFMTIAGAVTPTPTPTPTPTTGAFIQWAEGENGVRNGFDIVHATGVSAGKYIRSARTSGVVGWSVWVPTAGTYYMWCRTQTTSGSNDSLYVTMDDQRSEYTAGNGRYSVQWQWSRVGSGAMSQIPRAFVLAKGWHKLYVEAADVGVNLDGFLITDSAAFVPTDQTGMVRLQ